jgi:sulfate adenylyltransferase subunit 2
MTSRGVRETAMKHLRALEDQSVYILREAYKHFDDLAILWSMRKDSTVLLWLARKAFWGHVPFPLVHIDTGYEMPELIEYRDRLCREWDSTSRKIRLVTARTYSQI